MNKIHGFLFIFLSIIFFTNNIYSQSTEKKATIWADSVFNSLSDEQRIAQLLLMRVSGLNKSGVVFYDDQVIQAINKYNIGGVVLFQGAPVHQANIINTFQAAAKTPLLITIDAEWGLGMRMDSVQPLNQQLMLGATNDGAIIYQYGLLVSKQLKRAGIQVNFAPVVDINNNPENPVINMRSFGEDKFKVATYALQYMKALQQNGILACAKHFPGHGDVSVDSHLDLPVLNKSMGHLDSIELYPFKQVIQAGIGSIMVAHLFVPAIDTTSNTATSLSKKTVTDLLKNQLNFKGLIFTDALEMKGVSKFYPGGRISVQSLIAGNDMLCLPENVDTTIAVIKEAVLKNQLSMDDIYSKCKKVLLAKYKAGLTNIHPVVLNNLTRDLNDGIPELKKLVAENALTAVKIQDNILPFIEKAGSKKTAYLAIGIKTDNIITQQLKKHNNCDIFFWDSKNISDSTDNLIRILKGYSSVIIGIHNIQKYPVNNFGISNSSINLVTALKNSNPLLIVFGNPYALKNYCDMPNIIACYDDDEITQQAAFDFLSGKFYAKGTLPVTVCDNLPYGTGIIKPNLLPYDQKLFNSNIISHEIDSIAENAIMEHSTPGCEILALKNGRLIFEKSYGSQNYGQSKKIDPQSIFDLASMTKICATTISIMKLYGDKKLMLDQKLGDILSWTKGSDKANITIENLLLHESGLVADIGFEKKYRYMLNSFFDEEHQLRVADNLYISEKWPAEFNQLIKNSRLNPEHKYIYSDVGMILLAEVVEAITGKRINDYVQESLYTPLGLTSTGYKPLERFPKDRIVPTEIDHEIRDQQLQGDVHDPTAAFLGGVAGHAGLFSDGYDLAVLLQMVLNNGSINGQKFLDSATIQLFTGYNSNLSRRGLGFDKPEKDNEYRTEAYPSLFSSPVTYGHTGYTGTAFWVDPKYDLIYIFLSNRVNPNDSNKLGKMNVRGKVLDAFYKSLNLN